jgi:hypothetical protein
METTPSPWRFGTLLTFRFLFVYFVLFIFPFPIDYIPFSGYITQPLVNWINRGIDAIGPMLLGQYYQTPATSGSGDSSFHYARVITFATLAFIGMIVWSFIARQQHHPKLSTVLSVGLRYYLALNMLKYGFAKVLPTQFPMPPDAWLNQTFGESSPMRLLWTFMGHSRTYTIFSGIFEVVGGLLLLFRQTKLVGALLVAGVMLQVVMLNFSYDVPVKLFSLHLLAMSLVIMAPDVPRLVNFFFRNKAVAPQPMENYFTERKLNIATHAVKALATIAIVFYPFQVALQQYKEMKTYWRGAGMATNSEKVSLFGKYDVELFVLNNDTLPALEVDTRRWKSVMISGRSVLVESMDGYKIAWNSMISEGMREINMMSRDGFTTGKFFYTIDKHGLQIKGTLNDNTMTVTFRRKSSNRFLLTDRGFQWISEYPFNQ